MGFRALAVIPKVAIVRDPHVPSGEKIPYFVDATQYFIDLTALTESGQAPEKGKTMLMLEDLCSAWSCAAPWMLLATAPLAIIGLMAVTRKKY